MTQGLLTDMYYAAPELWYALAALFGSLLFLLGSLGLKLLKLKQKNYFLNRDRERYAETLYASQDGYFAFLYPDQKINDPRQNIIEHCSRRLAVIMNLPEGTKSKFEDILKNFYKEDAKVIQKYVELLKDDGVSFEDDFNLKNGNKRLHLSGHKINGIDGNIYCDMIWFRDVSFEFNQIASLEEEKNRTEEKVRQYEDLINNIPYPVWLRDENLNLKLINRKYLEFVEKSSPEEVIRQGTEINNVKGESISKNLALTAHAANKVKKNSSAVILNGERRFMEVIETPFHFAQNLNLIRTAGALIDITELDELKRNLNRHQNAQLEILGTLDTAFAVFDDKFHLSFYNPAFAGLWKLENLWLEQQPTYAMFLDVLREKRLLPEVPDFIAFKNEEQKAFSSIIEPKKDFLYLPDGRTFRRVRAPYPVGGLVFAFEDVSDNLATTRAYNSLLSVQKDTLDNLFDAVLIFASNGRLKLYNKAYLKLWNTKEEFLDKEPSILEIIESQKKFFSKVDDWAGLKKDILEHIIDVTTKSFALKRGNNDSVEVLSASLPDDSIMVTYRKIISTHDN